MLRQCSTLLPLMIFFSGVSLVSLIPGSKLVFQLSFIFIKMADMVSAWVIPIEPVIVGSMHLYTGWMLMAFLRSPKRNKSYLYSTLASNSIFAYRRQLKNSLIRLAVRRSIAERVCYSNTNNGVALPSSFIHAVVAAGQDPRHTDFF